MRRARSWFSLLLVAVLILMVAPPVMGQSQNCGDYVVVAGDTLFRIAQSYGMTVNDFAAANNLADPSAIFAGQHLIIPCAVGNTSSALQTSIFPPLQSLTAQTILQISGLYHRDLATTPVDLGVGFEMNNPDGDGQVAILDNQGLVSQLLLAYPDNVTGTLGGANEQFIYKMAVSNVDSAIGYAQYDPTTSGTVVHFYGLFGDPNSKLNVPIPLEDGITVSDFTMNSGWFLRTIGDITGGPNPDTKPGVELGGLMEGFAGDPFSYQDAPILGVRLSPDSSTVATSSIDGTYHIWDISSFGSAIEPGAWIPVASLSSDSLLVNVDARGNSMALAPGNGLLAFGDNLGNITLWNYRTNDKHTIEAFPGSPIQHVAFNEDGSLLAVSAGVLPANGAAPATQDSNIHIYDAQILANGIADPLVMTVVGPTQTVTGLAFSPHSRMLVAVAADRAFWLWGLPDSNAVQPQPVVIPTAVPVAVVPTVPPPASGCVNNFFVVGATGCSDASSITTSAVYQGFQNGFMIWLGDQKSILVVYNDGSANLYSDTWVNQPVITNEAPPAGMLQPDRGFGWVWTQQSGVKDKIGWATGVEVPYSIQYQVGHVDSPSPRPPGRDYYTLPDGMGAPIEVTFYDGAATWIYVS